MDRATTLPPPTWVDTPIAFSAMLARLRGEPALAIDTESNSLFVYRERVCLIQVSIPGSDYLVDPLALDDISALGPLLADSSVLKILHGAEYDISVLDRDFGFLLANLFDTMWASRVLGWPAHGLASLLKEHFGVTLDKKLQRANWGVRPLPAKQLDYARLDTHYLLPLYHIQSRELDAMGRWPQAQHRFGRVLENRWEPKQFDPDAFWRLPGVRDLHSEGRGVLRELFLFRERAAQGENRPPFKVLTNKTMLAVSYELPEDLPGLQRVRGISGRLVRKYGRKLLEAVQRGRKKPLTWDMRPRRSNARTGQTNSHASAACRNRYEALRAWRNEAAVRRGVEPDLVLTNRILWDVACQNPQCHADLAEDGPLARWQVEEFGGDVLRVVRNAG